MAWLNILGLIAAQAGINYSCAQFILPFLNLPSTPVNLFAMFAFILLTQGLLNHYGIRLVAILNDFSVTVHIAGVAAVVLALFFLAPKQPVPFLFEAVNSNGRSPYWWAFVLGLLQAQWTYTGFDASAHMAEETRDPRRRAPWGIVLSVAVSGVAGYFLLLALTLAIRSIPAVLAAKDAQGNQIPAVIAILQQALGAKAGNAMAALASMAMWFCGLACITSASRALYSLARDHGTPFAEQVRWVSPRHGTPAPGHLADRGRVHGRHALDQGGAGGDLAQHRGAVSGLYDSDRAGLARPAARVRIGPRHAVWSLGRFGAPLNLVAMLFAAFICVVLIMPPNELAGKTLAGLLAGLGLLYVAVVRKRFKGPEWSRHGG